MKIEIYGALFKNKGAELMLRAISEELKKKYSVKSAVLSLGVKSINDRQGNKFLYKTYPGINKFLEFIPSFLLSIFNIIKYSKVKYIIDASGFSYGDQWGLEATKYTSSMIRKWKNEGKEVIFFPQAFGPFSSIELKNYFKEIYDNAKFIFVRDKISFNEIIKVTNDNSKLAIYPDFTNLIDGQVPNDFNHHNCVAIIPNCRMLDKSKLINEYCDLLKHIIRGFLNRNENLFFLIHEGHDDYEIAVSLNQQLGLDLPIYNDYNAIQIKGIIGESKIVVSSRFHGLVSSLSQGIPCLGTSWSHKYQCLFEDYDYLEGLINTPDSKMINNNIDNLINNYDEISDSLKIKSEDIKSESRKMWELFYSMIES
jgi:colanic acid/amylovoran biosynthesis protein